MDAFFGIFSWLNPDERLVLFSGGNSRVAPVAAGVVGPNLGPNRRRATVATYARCKSPSSLSGCDLFVLGLRSGRERKLRSLSSRRRSEIAVAPWGGRYLFSRQGRRGGVFVSGPVRRVSRAVTTELDLRGRVGAFIATDVRSGADSIRVVYLGRRGCIRKCVVAVGRGDPEEFAIEQYGSLALSRRFVYWVSDRSGAEVGGSVLRRRLPSRRCVQRGRLQTLRRGNLGGSSTLESVAATRGRVYYTRDFPNPSNPPTFSSRFLLQMTDPFVGDP